MKKIELLAPAGDLEKLKIAVDYGADAVYFGGEMFSLRAGAGNLSIEEIEEGADARRGAVLGHHQGDRLPVVGDLAVGEERLVSRLETTTFAERVYEFTDPMIQEMYHEEESAILAKIAEMNKRM